MALTKIGLKILKDSFRTIISGSFRGELSSSASTFVGGGVSGSSISTGSFGRVEAAGVVFADSFKSVTGGTAIDFNDDISLTGNLTATGNVSGSITSTGSFGRVITSTADINGGTVDGITSLTAGGNLDIGTHDFRARKLTADNQTSGNVAIYSTAGLLSEDSDLTFSGATLSATNVTTTGTIKDFASVSGSYVSTGSVGRIQTRAADIGTITGTTLSTTGNISGSATSTGSFGRLQTQQGNVSIGGNIVTLGGNLTTAGTLTTQNNNVTINAVGAARTLTLNESLTVGDGHDGTITFGAASKTLTIENTSLLNQDLTTDASPTFAGATITGTLTVQEIHTEFESASILFTSGSTQFGNSTDDVHNVTGSMKITGSFQVDNGTLTAGTVDINGGTIDGITSLTAGGDLDIGAHDLRAATLTADGLTAGRVPFAGTAGLLSDDSDLTFATATLSATNLTTTGTIKNMALVSGSSVSTGSFGRVQTITAVSSPVGKFTTEVSSSSGKFTAITGVSTLTADGNLDIGAHDFRAATLTADGLTSGRVTFAGTNGVLSDDSDLTFATATLSATNLTTTGTIKNMALVSGSSVSTGSFGNVNVSLDLDVDGTTNLDVVDIDGAVDITTGIDGYAMQMTNVHDGSEGLLVRTTDNDTGEYILRLQSSAGATDTTYLDRFLVNKSGKVGIGTTSPTTKVQIKADSTEEDVILIEDNSGTDIGAIRIHGGAFMMKGKSSTAPIQLQTHDGNEDIEVDPDGFIKFETAGSERMRIDASGNVIIAGGELHNTSGEFTFRNTTDGENISFRTQAANTERLKIHSGGNVEVKTGDLVIGTAGKGIDFSAYATSGNPSSNLLDDYEEGTWTPQFFDASSGGVQAGVATATGIYVKVGSLVNLTCEINVNSLSGITMGNTVFLRNLPFPTKSSTSNMYPPIVVGYATALNISAGVSITGRVNHNNSSFGILSTFDNAGGITELSFTELSDNANLSMSMTYRSTS